MAKKEKVAKIMGKKRKKEEVMSPPVKTVVEVVVERGASSVSFETNVSAYDEKGKETFPSHFEVIGILIQALKVYRSSMDKHGCGECGDLEDLIEMLSA